MSHGKSGRTKEALDIEGLLERYPYRIVAGTIGVGFILGGGLFTRLTAGIVGAGLRLGLMAALPALQVELVGVGFGLLLAPRPGRELREEIRSRVRIGKDEEHDGGASDANRVTTPGA